MVTVDVHQCKPTTGEPAGLHVLSGVFRTIKSSMARVDAPIFRVIRDVDGEALRFLPRCTTPLPTLLPGLLMILVQKESWGRTW